eukprot:8660721-Alexandrium_andersonii.AAC.1
MCIRDSNGLLPFGFRQERNVVKRPLGLKAEEVVAAEGLHREVLAATAALREAFPGGALLGRGGPLGRGSRRL